MRSKSLIKTAIIGFLVVVLAGCSAPRLAYNNGQQLMWWWIDGYVDFSSEQAPAVKQSIDRWFDWHRSTQLPEYASLLGSLQAALLQPLTPADTCRWAVQIRDAVSPAIDRALEAAVEPVGTLGEREWRHIEQRFAKGNAEMRDEFLQPDEAQRLKASVERTLERAEMLYGSLGEAQQKLIAARVAASPFDPRAWLAERERRQRDMLQTLRRLASERADRDERLAAMRALAERWDRSADPAYRAYQARLTDYNCSFTADLHNSTTPAQRQAARAKLKGWEDDLRALATPQRAPG